MKIIIFSIICVHAFTRIYTAQEKSDGIKDNWSGNDLKISTNEGMVCFKDAQVTKIDQNDNSTVYTLQDGSKLTLTGNDFNIALNNYKGSGFDIQNPQYIHNYGDEVQACLNNDQNMTITGVQDVTTDGKGMYQIKAGDYDNKSSNSSLNSASSNSSKNDTSSKKDSGSKSEKSKSKKKKSSSKINSANSIVGYNLLALLSLSYISCCY